MSRNTLNVVELQLDSFESEIDTRKQYEDDIMCGKAADIVYNALAPRIMNIPDVSYEDKMKTIGNLRGIAKKIALKKINEGVPYDCLINSIMSVIIGKRNKK